MTNQKICAIIFSSKQKYDSKYIGQIFEAVYLSSYKTQGGMKYHWKPFLPKSIYFLETGRSNLHFRKEVFLGT